MPDHGIKDTSMVKDQFCLGNPFETNELDGLVIWAHSCEELFLYMGVQWSEIERPRRACISERQEQKPKSSSP